MPGEVVGIVRDLQFVNVREATGADRVPTFWQQNRRRTVARPQTHVRVSGDAAAMLPEMRRAMAAIDPDVPVTDVGPLGARLDFEFSDVRAARTLLVTFGTLTLVVSAIGLYAALAFAWGNGPGRSRFAWRSAPIGVTSAGLCSARGSAIVLIRRDRRSRGGGVRGTDPRASPLRREPARSRRPAGRAGDPWGRLAAGDLAAGTAVRWRWIR